MPSVSACYIVVSVVFLLVIEIVVIVVVCMKQYKKGDICYRIDIEKETYDKVQ